MLDDDNDSGDEYDEHLEDEEDIISPPDPEEVLFPDGNDFDLSSNEHIHELGISDIPEHGLLFSEWTTQTNDTDLLSILEKEMFVEDNLGHIWSETSDPFSDLSDTYTIEVHGTPNEDIAFWDQQDNPNSCAVATTNMMFQSLGLNPGESFIADVFENMGIYDPDSGTDPHSINEAINDIADQMNINIQANEINGFTEESLIEMLDNDIRPLVGVDASELYDDFWIPSDSGHAVQVTGIINTQEGNFVVINDPGFEEGAGQTIPLDRFMSAADDFGFTAVSVTVI